MKPNPTTLAKDELAKTTFHTLFQNMFEAVVIYNYTTETLKDINQATLDLFGYSRKEVLVLNRFDLMPRYSSLYPNIDIHDFIHKDHVKKVLNNEKINILGELTAKDGRKIFAELSIVPTGFIEGDAFVIMRDVTNEMMNRQLLSESKQKFQRIIDHAKEAIVYYDLKTQKCLECNKTVTEIFGVQSKEVFMSTPLELFYCEEDNDLNKLSAKGFFQNIVDRSAEEGSFSIKYKARRMNGEKFIAEVTTVCENSDEANPRMITFTRDITLEFYAQKERDELYNEMSQMMDSMPIQFAYKDLNNNFVRCNQAMKDMLDDGRGNVEGRNLREFISKADAKKFWEEDLAIAKSKNPKLNMVVTIKNKEGKKKWGKVSKLPFLDLEGNTKGILSYVVDITDVVEGQEKVKKSEQDYKILFDNAFDGIMVYDVNEKRAVRCNEGLALYLSTDPEEILMRSLADYSPEYQSNGMRSDQELELIISNTKKLGNYKVEWDFEEKNGNILISEINTFLLKREGTHQVVFIFKDITERKRRDKIIRSNVRDLNNKNKELKRYIESNNQLENFAAIASHDLQAPLRTIHSYTQLLQRSIKETATDNQKDYMHFITSATSNMRHLIRDLRAFSKVDSTQLNIRSIYVGEMLEEILGELKTTIDHQKAKIHLAANMPTIDGDRVKLRQLFQNLITNALKYIGENVTPEIHISVEDQIHHWRFRITDNGIGIPPEYHKKIFLLFERLHGRGEFSGTGIGLSLCKKVVEQHLGIIAVDSEVGKGSSFYFTIHKNVKAKLEELTGR